MMQLLNKVRRDGSFRYPDSLEDVEDEDSYYALAKSRYTIETRDFISNTDRLIQMMERKAKATLGMVRPREDKIRGGLVVFRFEITERTLLEILPLLG